MINERKFEIKVPYIYVSGDEWVEIRGQVFRYDSIICKVHSNEINNHHRPHVHIILKNTEFVVSIDNRIEVLSPKKIKNSIKNILIRDIVMNINKCREEWNIVQSLVKFKESELKIGAIEIIDGIGYVKS